MLDLIQQHLDSKVFNRATDLEWPTQQVEIRRKF